MIEPLYTKIIEKNSQIKKEFEDYHKDIDIEKVKKAYIYETFTKNLPTKTFISTDGSLNQRRHITCFFYAVTSQTILSVPGENIKKEAMAADVGTFTRAYSTKFDKIISNTMEIFEIKSTLKTLKKYDNIDYILIDGSLRGQLKNFKVPYELDKTIQDNIKDEINELEDQLTENTFEVELHYEKYKGALNQLIETINDSKSKEEIDDIKMDAEEYFIALEMLSCIRHLINNYSEKIICISKTSTTRNLFKENIPDVAVLEYAIPETGYTKPEKMDNQGLIIRINDDFRTIDYPLYKEEISKYNYIVTFTRLENRKNFLKIEIPLKDDKNVDKIKNDIKTILEDIYSCSIEGYPHILKKVHEDVVIKNKDMDTLELKAEIIEKTGRDMLKR